MSEQARIAELEAEIHKLRVRCHVAEHRVAQMEAENAARRALNKARRHAGVCAVVSDEMSLPWA